MSVIENILLSRNLPDLLSFADGKNVTFENWSKRKDEILSILSNEIYGTAPDAPQNITFEKTNAIGKYGNFAGKAYTNEVNITFDTENGKFTIPCVEIVPKSSKKIPVFININFRPDIPDRYLPVEEIIDEGYAIVRLYYNDVALDENDNFEGGIASKYDRKKYTWGKIRMWAWAISRIIDYLYTTDYADTNKIAVVGHSRLGKTALVCSAFDERVCLACSNDSGCSGDAITRNKKGEHIADIIKVFPFWFCENYKKYVNNEDALPFDQHFLIAASAPRRVSLGAALNDEWADPESQYLGACAASAAWELLSENGFIHPDRLPNVNECFNEGKLSYHLRSGDHFLSRTDWLFYLDDMKKL